MKVLLTLSFLIFYNNLTPTKAIKDNFTLELVQVLFRHGDRTPLDYERYKTDPYDPEFYEEYGYGQLTKIGMKREHKLGQMLRKRYNEFLGDYNVEDVYAYSTDTDRTKTSLQLVLNGLYPPTEKTRWSKEIDWIPIPTHYEPFKTDFMSFDFFGVCSDGYQKLFDEAEESHGVIKIMKKNRDIFEYVKNETQITSTRATAFTLIALNLECALSLGLPLPDWCSNAIYEKLKEVYISMYDITSHTTLMKKMTIGPIIERFLENIYNGEKGKAKKKIHLYSGHDMQIGHFTRAHNFKNVPARPDFGSAVIIEKLRGSDDNTYIRMLYWTGVTEKLIALKLEKCNYECLLSDYVNIISPVLPEPGFTKCER